MPHKDGVDNLIISWDDSSHVFTTGEVISGQIQVIVNETTAFRGIRLRILGTVQIQWNDQQTGNEVSYEEFQRLVDDNLEIFVPNLKDRNARWIFPGKHVFNFKYQLPSELPYNLDSKYGQISYTSKAEVVIPGANPVESLEVDFKVRSRHAQKGEKKLMVQGEKLPKENVEYGAIGGGLFVKKSHMEVQLRLEKSVYKQGQVITGLVEITVEKGKVGVEGALLVLVQQSIYTINMNEIDEVQKRETQVVSVASSDLTVKPGTSRIYNLKIKIDPCTVPTGYPHCEYIDTGYYVHAVAKNGRKYDDVVVKLPIVILFGGEKDWEELVEDQEPPPEDQVVVVFEDEALGPVNVQEEQLPEWEKEGEVQRAEEGEETQQNLPGQVEEVPEEKKEDDEEDGDEEVPEEKKEDDEEDGDEEEEEEEEEEEAPVKPEEPAKEEDEEEEEKE